MLVANQTWITLQTLIQEAFQRQLNATAPTAGHHKYNPAQRFQENTFDILGEDNNDEDEELFSNMLASQVAALTYQSQLTQSMAVNTSHCQEQQMARITAVQSATHNTHNHVIAQLSGFPFNASDAGHGHYAGHRYGGGGGRSSFAQGHGCGPPMSICSFPQGGVFSPTMGTCGCHAGIFPPVPPGSFLGGPTSGPSLHHAPPPTINGGYGLPGEIGIPPAQAHVHQQP
jgi:hypothetical protein